MQCGWSHGGRRAAAPPYMWHWLSHQGAAEALVVLACVAFVFVRPCWVGRLLPVALAAGGPPLGRGLGLYLAASSLGYVSAL